MQKHDTMKQYNIEHVVWWDKMVHEWSNHQLVDGTRKHSWQPRHRPLLLLRVCSERIPFVRTPGVSAALSTFLSLLTLTFDLDIQTQARFLYNAPNCQVSSSYI